MRTVLLHEEIPKHARPDERDALVQLAGVERVLRELGHECVRLPMGLDLDRTTRTLRDLRPALVFNFVEALGGSGRLGHLAPSLVEPLGIPCTGASAVAFLETTDKLHAKRRLLEADLPTPAWLFVGGESHGTPAVDPGARFIVKPIHEDASVGLEDDAVVQGAAAARARLASAPWPVFAEVYVEGREINLALLEKSDGVELLPPSEILFEDWPAGKPRIVGYAAKWDEASFEATNTPRRLEFPASDSALLGQLGELAHRCWRLFGLNGWARVDFRVDADGRPFILEVNANPCLSPDAGFAAASARAGLSTRDVVQRIVAAALSRGTRPSPARL